MSWLVTTDPPTTVASIYHYGRQRFTDVGIYPVCRGTGFPARPVTAGEAKCGRVCKRCAGMIHREAIAALYRNLVGEEAPTT